MTRLDRTLGLALAAIAVTAPAALGAQPGMPPNDPDSWKVAGTAKVLCSALFVSGRDSAEARAHVADYFLREKLDSITSLHVDRQRKLVRLTVAGRITREAKLYGDQGCVIHQPGRDSVFFKPVRVTSRLPDAATTPWPMGDLLPNDPPPAGLDTARLRQATDSAFASPAGLTAGFVVVHRGRIVAERYANGAHRDMQLESWSMGKSITGTLVGLLVQQGALRLEDPAPVPEWRKTPADPRARIRVIDLLRMSSGLRFSRGSPEDLPGYHDHDLIYTGAIDAFQFAVTREPQFAPNTFGRYRNVDVMTLGLLIRDAVRKRGEEYLTWPQRALFDKIGIRRQVLETDPYGNFLLSGYDYGTARNWARLGMLYLNDGVWNGERLLPEGWTKLVSTPAPAWADSSYGGMVWVNARGAWPLPRDAFAFRGAGGQETYVVPSLDLVVVRMGHFPGSRVGGQDLRRALRLIAEAVPARPQAVPAGGYQRPATLNDGWRTASADSLGVDSAALARLTASVRGWPELGVHAILIERAGRLIYEAYFDGFDERWGQPLGRVTMTATTKHDLRSVTKSVVSALAGIALHTGAIPTLEQPVVQWFPEYPELNTGERRRVTLAHVLGMTSGLRWNEDIPYTDPRNDEIRMTRDSAPLRYALAVPFALEPGADFNYNGGLTQVMAAVIERATKVPIEDYARTRLFEPLGITDSEWVGELAGMPSAASGLRLRPRDLAKFGSLYLHGGRWNGKQVLPEVWVDLSTRRQFRFRPPTGANSGGEFGYAYFWWYNCYPTAAGLVEARTAVGNGQQRIYVLPGLDMVVTILAGRYNDFTTGNTLGSRILREHVVPAVKTGIRSGCSGS